MNLWNGRSVLEKHLDEIIYKQKQKRLISQTIRNAN